MHATAFRHFQRRTFHLHYEDLEPRRAAPGLRGACIAPPGWVDTSEAKVVGAAAKQLDDRGSRGAGHGLA